MRKAIIILCAILNFGPFSLLAQSVIESTIRHDSVAVSSGHSIPFNPEDTVTSAYVNLSETYSAGTQQTNRYTTQAEVVYKLFNKKLGLQAIVPYSFITGPLPTNSGFGNLSLGVLPTLFKNDKIFVYANATVRFPIGNTSAEYNDSVLYPSPYQTAHDHTDLSLALNLNEIKSNWHIGIAYNHIFHPPIDSPVIQNKKKAQPDTTFVTQNNNSLSLKIEKYFYTGNFRFDATASPNIHFQNTQSFDSAGDVIGRTAANPLNLSLNGAVHYSFTAKGSNQPANNIFFAMGITGVANINSSQTLWQAMSFTIGYRHSFF